MAEKHKVAILGASDKADRYSNLLLKRLRSRGHQVFPVNPALASIDRGRAAAGCFLGDAPARVRRAGAEGQEDESQVPQ